MPKVVEVINFLHELDLLEAHLTEHCTFMDKIVIVESELTYSGMKKPLLFYENRKRFEAYNVEHEVIPVSMFVKIPDEYEEKDRKKWFDTRRNNREAQQTYIFNKYKKGFDYICNTDVDEIWSRNSWHHIEKMMREEHCYIAPRLRRFMYRMDSMGKVQDYWRITKTDQPTHVRQRGKKRNRTPVEVGWHFTTCYKDPKDVWMKGVGLAQTIGQLGWKRVPTPEECQKLLDNGILPFLNQKINPKRIVDSSELSWLPEYIANNPTKFPWLEDKYIDETKIIKWRLPE